MIKMFLKRLEPQRIKIGVQSVSYTNDPHDMFDQSLILLIDLFVAIIATEENWLAKWAFRNI